MVFAFRMLKLVGAIQTRLEDISHDINKKTQKNIKH